MVASHLCFQNAKDLLLQTDKLLQLQERKVRIMAAIQASLPITDDEAILWDIWGT